MYLFSKSILKILLFTFVFNLLHAQNLIIPILGESKARLNWQHISDEKVQVIFPSGLEDKAQRIVSLIGHLHDSLQTLGQKKHKISVILRNQTNIPNGFVAFTPFRSEFFTTPPQFGFAGTTNWLDLLAVHEYRHVQQFNNSNTGITKLLGIVFGQFGKAIAQYIALPPWFFEGDATLNETLHTPSGRGTFSDFVKDYRALTLTRKLFSYEKASAIFSYKDYIPNHYHIGYYMTAYIRKHYGKDIWAKVVKDANNRRGLFYSFSHSLKKYTGFRTPELYQLTFYDLTKYWKAHSDTLQLTASTLINQKLKTTFTSYNYPRYIDENTWLIQKSSFDEISSFYTIDRSGKEKRLLYTGANTRLNRTVSYKDGWIVWAEIRVHPRWNGTDYSIIRIKNIYNQRYYKITSQSRYFSPSLNNNKDRIITVSVDENAHSQLHIIDLKGAVLKTLPNPENLFYTFPIWDDNDEVIVVVAHKNSQNTLMSIDISSGKTKTLIDYTTELISRPYTTDNYIFFSATYGGINNIYAFDKKNNRTYQVTSTLLGAYQPSVSPDGQKLVFSEFTYKGYDLKEIPIEVDQWQPLVKKDNFSETWLKPVLEQEQTNLYDKNFIDKPLEVKPYQPLKHFFNLHSWSIIPNSISVISNPSRASLGTNLFLNDKFNNFSGVLAYNYNLNEKTNTIGVNLQFGGLFPIFDLGINTTNRQNTNLIIKVKRGENGDRDTASLNTLDTRWTQTDFSFGVSIPFSFNSGSSLRYFGFITRYHLLNLNYQDRFIDGVEVLTNEIIPSFELGLVFINRLRTALKNLNTRFGQQVTLSYQRTFQSKTNMGKRLNITGIFWFPGLSKNHSLVFQMGYSRELSGNTYKYLDNFFYSRGHTSVPIHDRKHRLGVDYSLPLVYPDLTVRGLLLWRRTFLNLFFDYTKLRGLRQSVDHLPSVPRVNISGFSNPSTNEALVSLGAELFFEFRVFRLLNVTLGGRYNYPLTPGVQPGVEFVLRSFSL